MHYSTCAVVLAAGSSIASASTHIFAGDLSNSQLLKRDLVRRELLRRATPSANNNAKPVGGSAKIATPPKTGDTNKDAAKNIANLFKAFTPNKSAASAKTPPIPNFGGKMFGGPATPPAPNTNTGGLSSAQDAADERQARRAARLQGYYADEYHKVHKPLPGQTLKDDTPPPASFSLSETINTGTVTSNNYQGAVTNNDNSMYATGGSTIAKDGAKIDKSMNDNRQQVAQGATVNGNTSNTRNTKRDEADSYTLKEDARVVYRDFVLLVRAMRRNPDAKEQVLYEIAGIPGFRDFVEGLIASYTDTNGQLTMNNFAALVSAMTQDKSVEIKTVDAFNSNVLYAVVIEKLLTQYYEPQDQEALETTESSKKKKSGSKKSSTKKSSSKESSTKKSGSKDSSSEESSSKARRGFDNEHFKLALRSIERNHLQIQARDILDEYDAWLAARELDEHVMQLLGRDLDTEMLYDPDLFY